VCGFATHRFEVFVLFQFLSRFFNHGILFHVSAFIVHVHMGKLVAFNTYTFVGGRVEMASETSFQILICSLWCIVCGVSCYWI
jgi:hypothetical protein